MRGERAAHRDVLIARSALDESAHSSSTALLPRAESDLLFPHKIAMLRRSGRSLPDRSRCRLLVRPRLSICTWRRHLPEVEQTRSGSRTKHYHDPFRTKKLTVGPSRHCTRIRRTLIAGNRGTF